MIMTIQRSSWLFVVVPSIYKGPRWAWTKFNIPKHNFIKWLAMLGRSSNLETPKIKSIIYHMFMDLRKATTKINSLNLNFMVNWVMVIKGQEIYEEKYN